MPASVARQRNQTEWQSRHTVSERTMPENGTLKRRQWVHAGRVQRSVRGNWVLRARTVRCPVGMRSQVVRGGVLLHVAAAWKAGRRCAQVGMAQRKRPSKRLLGTRQTVARRCAGTAQPRAVVGRRTVFSTIASRSRSR